MAQKFPITDWEAMRQGEDRQYSAEFTVADATWYGPWSSGKITPVDTSSHVDFLRIGDCSSSRKAIDSRNGFPCFWSA